MPKTVTYEQIVAALPKLSLQELKELEDAVINAREEYEDELEDDDCYDDDEEDEDE